VESQALITNDAVVLGLLLAILAFVFTTHSSKSTFWKRLCSIVPSILVCYFLPSVLATLGVIDGEGCSSTSWPHAICCQPAWSC
jgi:uncharacterized membrane protein